MYTRKRYRLWDMVKWTRFETYIFVIIAIIPTALFHGCDLAYLQIPWTPIAVIGTAVAFVIGFQNNAAYGRIWEARKIWGGITNYSRTWGVTTRETVNNLHAKTPASEEELADHIRQLHYRHFAWLTALRHAMRTKRAWETFEEERSNREWSEIMKVPEKKSSLEDDLKLYLSEEERAQVLSKTNKATAVLDLQSKHVGELRDKGLVWEFSFLRLERLIEELFNLQGKSERIKNFPYPRQYSTLSHFFVWAFIILLPLGVAPQFLEVGEKLKPSYPLIGTYFSFLSVPFVVMISWIFHTMERIGRVGENPFEGSANDVPISNISRAIEIDMRQIINEPKEKIPEPLEIIYDVQY